MISDNPFINKQFPIPWAELTHQQAKIDIKLAINIFQEQIDFISNLNDDQIDYNSVFTTFDKSFINFSQCSAYLHHLISVNDSAQLRSVYQELNPEMAKFRSNIFLNPKLWSVIKRASEKIDKSKLTDEQIRFIEQTILEFELKGADLSDDKKEELLQIEVETAKLTEKYRSNILDSLKKFELFVNDEKELDGLPQSLIQQARKAAQNKGHNNEYLFTLQSQTIRQVMKYAKSEKLRKKLWEGQCSIGHIGEFDNGQIIHQILTFRNRKANLLGFDTFADLALKNMMALNGENALHFVDDLHDKVYSKFMLENEELINYKRKIVGDENAEIFPWERLYYSELLCKEKYDFDYEILQPYFSIEKVLNVLFHITSSLFGVEYKECETFYRSSPSEPLIEGKIEVWHEDVKYFEVFDKKTGEQLGGFYADLYARENKRNCSWHQSLHYLYPLNPKNLTVLCCNIQKPSEEEGIPSLLDFSDVVTIFHEFGHLCHSILTKTSINSFAGTKVARDFVELPSQLLENWTYEREAMNLFAKHYETGEIIPRDVFEKMIKSKNYHSAIFIMSQLSMAKIDLEIHHHFKKYENLNVDQIDDLILNEYRPHCSVDQPSLLYNFSHIFSSPEGYASCCYSYMWGKELEADAFTRFINEGIINEKVGIEFRDKILAMGNSNLPSKLFKNFMGRDPDPKALLIREGIKG